MPEITARWAPVFEDLLGKGQVYATADDLAAHAEDETHERRYLPDLVLKPRTVEQISQILKTCNEAGLPVVPRGGGSGVSGGALAVQGGVVLCMERLNRIIDLDPANMTIMVETGAITGEVQSALLEKGLCLPPDPGSKSWCQIGGNLAEAAAGPKSVKYGAFRDYVLNLEVVLPSGEVMWTGASVRKIACGYNLTQLMLGSEGTLAVITKVVFKVIPAPREEILLRLAFPNLDQAGRLVCRLFEAGLTPSEVEFLDGDAIGRARGACDSTVDEHIQALVWVGFDGTREELLLEDAERVAELAEELGADEPLLAQEKAHRDQLWEFRHKVGTAVIETTTFLDVDISFPRARLGDIIRGVKEIGRKFGFNTVAFGHVGDGNLHVQVLRDDLDEQAWNGRVREGIGEIYSLATSMGGALSGEHGIGCTLQPYMDRMFSPTQLNLMAGIKQVFDPKGILNPGKILP